MPPVRQLASSGHMAGQNAYISVPSTLDPYGHTARPSSYCHDLPPLAGPGSRGSDVSLVANPSSEKGGAQVREGEVGDTTAGETRRAGIQLNGAQGRDLLLFFLSFFSSFGFLLLDFGFWI